MDKGSDGDILKNLELTIERYMIPALEWVHKNVYEKIYPDKNTASPKDIENAEKLHAAIKPVRDNINQMMTAVKNSKVLDSVSKYLAASASSQ